MLIVMFLFLCLMLFLISSKLHEHISEKIRQKILSKYTLSDVQAKWHVSQGEEVYTESSKDNIFAMLSGCGRSVIIKNLFSGKEAALDISQFMNTFSSLTDNGYKFYDAKSYKELLKRGFKISCM